MDGGAWRATDHQVAKSQTGLSDCTFTFFPSENKDWGEQEEALL